MGACAHVVAEPAAVVRIVRIAVVSDHTDMFWTEKWKANRVVGAGYLMPERAATHRRARAKPIETRWLRLDEAMANSVADDIRQRMDP